MRKCSAIAHTKVVLFILSQISQILKSRKCTYWFLQAFTLIKLYDKKMLQITTHTYVKTRVLLEQWWHNAVRSRTPNTFFFNRPKNSNIKITLIIFLILTGISIHKTVWQEDVPYLHKHACQTINTFNDIMRKCRAIALTKVVLFKLSENLIFQNHVNDFTDSHRHFDWSNYMTKRYYILPRTRMSK